MAGGESMEAVFRLRGGKAEVEAALTDIAALSGVETVRGTPEPVVGSVLSRGRQHQIELVECIVSVVLGLATSAAYDGLKAAVAAIGKRREIEATEEDESTPQ
ncbi:hypothetical protein D2V17_09085 [Aurantiacibacter xanthus]|uniref:Uncharacterized protein n=2 Tax=Aurantiacibacter xanthus TaxID=1784712 RepID=A0A3A1P625_9SPHN|nr:hypothetical protein D2V17_09085 [Aurantiacibacter xanthus]